MSYIVAKYIRLSIEDAKTESLSIENQRLVLDSFIDAMDKDDVEVMEFVDNGYTGTHFERPAVQGLLDLVRAGKVHCIVVKDFTRFGRNAVESGYFLQRVFPLFRTRFIALTDGYDSADHEGDTGGLDIAFRLLLSERYSRDMSKKIKASKLSKALRGEAVSKYCVYGFKKAGNRLEIDGPAAETVRLVFDLASGGKNLTEIAERLYADKRPTPSEYRKGLEGCSCIWSKLAIYSMLYEEQYIGTYTAGKSKRMELGSGKSKKVDESEWIRIPDFHPAIVDKAVFKAAQESISYKSEPIRRREISASERYDSIERPLKGIVVCGCCGHKMSLSCTRNAVFQCRYTFAASDEPCYRLKIADSEASAIALDAIRKLAQSGIWADGLDMPPQSGSEFSSLIAANKKAKQELYERFIRGEIGADEYMTGKTPYDNEIERLTQNHAALKTEMGKMAAAREMDRQIRALSEDLSSETKLSSTLADLLIDKVEVFPGGRVKVNWKTPGFEPIIMEGKTYV